MRELLELDHALYPKLPDPILKGYHLPMLYAIGHEEIEMNELRVIHFFENHPDMTLSSDDILKLYQIMTAGTGLEKIGYKTENNYIDSGEFMYIPASCESVPCEMETLCAKYGYLLGIAPEQAEDVFKFLLEFICIHPFDNGNGRLSALLVQWLLWKAGYQCAFYLPYDAVMHRMNAKLYQREIVRASGIFYGQKPYVYDSFIALQKKFLKDSYHRLEAAYKKLL